MYSQVLAEIYYHKASEFVIMLPVCDHALLHMHGSRRVTLVVDWRQPRDVMGEASTHSRVVCKFYISRGT